MQRAASVKVSGRRLMDRERRKGMVFNPLMLCGAEPLSLIPLTGIQHADTREQ
jgi:hypothetical protein